MSMFSIDVQERDCRYFLLELKMFKLLKKITRRWSRWWIYWFSIIVLLLYYCVTSFYQQITAQVQDLLYKLFPLHFHTYIPFIKHGLHWNDFVDFPYQTTHLKALSLMCSVSPKCRNRKDRLFYCEQHRLPAAQGDWSGWHLGDGVSAQTGPVSSKWNMVYSSVSAPNLPLPYSGGMIQTTEQYQFLYSTLAQYSSKLQHSKVSPVLVLSYVMLLFC